jgi:hypothetical protein
VNPLPVEWLNISASRTAEREVTIKWSTASEINNDHFELEADINGSPVLKGVVEAGKNPATVQHYNFVDGSDVSKVSRYRIKQVDRDGRSDYSQWITVQEKTDRSQLLIYPNPAHHSIYLSSKESVTIISLTGKVIYEGNTDFVDTGSWPRGLYMVTNGVEKYKLILE